MKTSVATNTIAKIPAAAMAESKPIDRDVAGPDVLVALVVFPLFLSGIDSNTLELRVAHMIWILMNFGFPGAGSAGPPNT
eukprot:CAMPEP_0184670350 /NCGR_PEP_ID=MMETSP0308-20130426/81850_1 /TAXON_ID=38269 /ORGANISM="Gloeochaete witrockiana, Strain SAG 46.84" /LENGTH=79 /DNA_ID=CAMNT_0027117059 /DNA_START=328 /DNA_END=567 /DNA_ORIENTATION=+